MNEFIKLRPLIIPIILFIFILSLDIVGIINSTVFCSSIPFLTCLIQPIKQERNS